LPLLPPPRDKAGNVLPHDHDGITASDGVIRRIQENWLVDDPKVISGKRITSMAFKPSSGPNGGMSVDLEQLVQEAGKDTKAFVTTPRWIGSIRYTAGALRAEGFQVGFHPIPENPFHGEVWGEFSKLQQGRLRNIAEWFVRIEGVSI
jgi:hypothetical protein